MLASLLTPKLNENINLDNIFQAFKRKLIILCQLKTKRFIQRQLGKNNLFWFQSKMIYPFSRKVQNNLFFFNKIWNISFIQWTSRKVLFIFFADQKIE